MVTIFWLEKTTKTFASGIINVVVVRRWPVPGGPAQNKKKKKIHSAGLHTHSRAEYPARLGINIDANADRPSSENINQRSIIEMAGLTDGGDERESVEERHGEGPGLSEGVAILEHHLAQGADDLVLVVAHLHPGQMGPVVPVQNVEILRDGPQTVHRGQRLLQEPTVRIGVVQLLLLMVRMVRMDGHRPPSRLLWLLLTG